MNSRRFDFKQIWSSAADHKHLLEGPVLSPDGTHVYFTDCFRGIIYRFDPRQPQTDPEKYFSFNSLYCNGLQFLNNNIMVACLWKGFVCPRGALHELNLNAGKKPTSKMRVARTTTNRRLKHPNDLAVDEREGVYFTDMRRKKVYYHGPGEKQARALCDLKRPNGIELEFVSDKAQFLYVSDSKASTVVKYAIIRPGEIRKLKTSDPFPGGNAVDGLALSAADELFVAEEDYIYVLDRHLNIIDQTKLPQTEGKTVPSNICFVDEKTFVVTSYLKPSILHPGSLLKKAELFLGTITG
ncbi:SMP-30/gluconolactonase/LRE family protein [Gimesia sp.]|uniref:SMP-30/gluconolactonase/LRE family protein n=1 Tax=Gimesia sp. TaxID=2024833 RepID=UPI003A8FC1DA